LFAGAFSENIALEAVTECLERPRWLKDYRKVIKDDDAHERGNPLKTALNRQIASRIRSAIGGEVKKSAPGKPVTAKTLASVIQSFTLLESFAPAFVA
jgi:hypothetical protein